LDSAKERISRAFALSFSMCSMAPFVRT
jgi:hypothetical protein